MPSNLPLLSSSADASWPGRAQLPDSIFPLDFTPLLEHNPEELERLASRPQKILPFDPKTPCERRLANLAQYRGRTAEGQRRSLGNLRRKVTSVAKKQVQSSPGGPTVDPEIPQPVVPVATAGLRSPWTSRKGRNLRAVLDKWEYDFYVAKWYELWQGHAQDVNDSNDRIDVHAICMETVTQLRLLRLRRIHPERYRFAEYHQCFTRMQRARENLSSRRTDRLNDKQNATAADGILTTLIGGADAKELAARSARNQQLEEEEISLLERTVAKPIAPSVSENRAPVAPAMPAASAQQASSN